MKFIYLADTHISGSDDAGYRKQPRYLKYFPEIIKCLENYIKEAGDIDFIIHGGDMIDKTTPEAIREAADLFGRLPCPTYLALGNHDLTTPDAVEMWLVNAPQFFSEGKTDFRLIKDGVQIDVLLCHWGETPAYWHPDIPQVPWLSPQQIEQIANVDAKCHTRIIVMHSPIYGIPPEQYGGTEPIHAPAGDFCEKLLPIMNNASLVLGAHNHMNMVLTRDGCHYITTAALSETPFEFKVIEVTDQKLSMQTITLNSSVSFRGDYDFEATYVQGRACDRNIESKNPKNII